MPRTNKNQEWRRNDDGTTTLIREETVTVPDSVIARENSEGAAEAVVAKAERIMAGSDETWSAEQVRRILAAVILKLTR